MGSVDCIHAPDQCPYEKGDSIIEPHNGDQGIK